MRVAIFGMGRFYINRREELLTLCTGEEIVCFFDNKIVKGMGKKINGVSALNPEELKLIEFDCIIIMSVHIREIYIQLCKLGVPIEKIYTWENYRILKNGGQVEEIPTMLPCNDKEILIITNPVRYDGGSMAAMYAAMALRSRSYSVWIVTAYVEEELKDRLLKEGVNLAICSDIPYLGRHAKKWISSFNNIIVNVFPNVNCVFELGKSKPIVWWLHESDVYGKIYQMTFERFPQYQGKTCGNAVSVVAVSDKARINFKRYYPDIPVRIMPYGLPDEILKKRIKNEVMIFAIIGNICYLKGQDIFIEAAKKIIEKKENVEFWIIGNCEGDYAKDLLQNIENIDYIKIKGEVSRAEMKNIFSEIDVIVSASREDSLPIVVAEGMMNSKTCVISDVIGTVEYVRDNENGIIFKSQDVDDLSSKMNWCIHNREKLEEIGDMARKTYEKIFSMNVFAENLKKEIIYAENKYKENRKW